MSDGTDGQKDGQDEVLAFLGDPATHGGQNVQRIDTHAASVFLAGDRALKIKRAVRFPFLDYSTLEKRKQACEAELAVNAPYAPEIYRGVVAITREAERQARDRRLRRRRSNGRSRCSVSTRSGPSTTSPAKSTKRWPTRSAAPSPPLTPRRVASTPNPGSRRSAPISTNTAKRSAQHPEIFPAAENEAFARDKSRRL